jgi:hypothetical protein
MVEKQAWSIKNYGYVGDVSYLYVVYDLACCPLLVDILAE